MIARTSWLNGWPRIGNGVLMGTAWHCVGCGQFQGLGCVALEPDHIYPKKSPDWPFDEATCPVHTKPPDPEEKFDTWPPRVADLYMKLKNAERELAEIKAQRSTVQTLVEARERT